MNLIKTYESILRYAGFEADDNGYIYHKMDEKREPALLDGARLVLPLPNNLKNYRPGEMIVFHPLSENIIRGESEVIKKLTKTINIRLNYVFGILAQSLLRICTDNEEHKLLTPDQTELLIAVPNVDHTSLTNFTSIMLAAFKDTTDSFFINIYLRRGITLHGVKTSRAGITQFNFWNLLSKDPDNILGVKIRQKDIQIYKDLYKFILPNLNAENEYSYGSLSGTAPFLDALMKSSLKTVSKLSDIVEVFGDRIDESEELVFDSNWVTDFINLDDPILLSEIRKVPVQYGNEGSVKVIEQAQVQQPAHQPREEQLPVPVYQKPAEPVYLPPHLQQQQPQQLPTTDQYGRPIDQYGRLIPPNVDQYGRPIMPQQQVDQYGRPMQMQPEPELQITKNGIDFKSLLRKNPALAMQPNALATQLNQGMQPMGFQQQQPPPPGWAPQPVDQFGRPMQQQPVDQYGRPMQQQPVDQYGRPMQQQPVDQYGRPMQQQPVDQYGRPMQQQPIPGNPFYR